MVLLLASFFDLFRRGNSAVSNEGAILDDLGDMVSESRDNDLIVEIKENNLGEDSPLKSVESIVLNESKTSYSPDSLSKMIGEDSLNTDTLLGGLRSVYNFSETFVENEEMSRDSIIGAAMEIMADDSCQKDERTGTVVSVESEDEGLQRFLNDFLTNNVNIEDRIWTWAFEIVKHGDLKLRRREYYAGSPNSGVRNVYYEDVINPYLVSRIEYMGNILGFEDEDLDDVDPLSSNSAGMKASAKFERPDSFIHFMSSKLSRREKIRLRVRDKDDRLETVVCYRVVGTSVVDNARFIFRINNMIDNMLVLSRIARSTQYNLVKIEVGNASAGKTQQILMDTRRRLEGSTKIKKNVGMKTDPSPIPINSNVYIPTRDGKGDVTVESVGDNVDVRSIVDVDYFKDKEFAALKVPKQYLGFDECLKYETKVRLLNGHVYEIGYLAEHPELWEGKSVMTCSPEGVLSPSKIVHVKKTRKDATYVRVRIDNGEYVDVTPDHLMMLRDGTFKEAGKLVPGDSLMPFVFKYNGRGRMVVRQNKDAFENKWELQYRIVEEFCYKNETGKEIPKGYHVHHIDRVKSNDDPTNLQVLSLQEHCYEHTDSFSDKGHEANRGREVTEETRKKLSIALKGRKFSVNHKEKISEALKGRDSNNPFKSGESNIMKNPDIVRKQKKSLRDYYDNGGTTWQKQEGNEEKVKGWVDRMLLDKHGSSERGKRREVKCAYCGKVFLSDSMSESYFANWIKSSRCCSRECSFRYRFPEPKKDFEFTCFCCGKPIVRKLTDSEIVEYVKKPHFCSKGCINRCRTLLKSLEVYNKIVSELGYVTEGIYTKEAEQYGGKIRSYKEFMDSDISKFAVGYQNHKVVSVEPLVDIEGNLIVEDAYDLGVESENHTFPLEIGIFVHNSLSSLGNNSLVKMDLRYARSVLRVQGILINGIKALCNNYLAYRGRKSDINKFKIKMRPLSTSENTSRVEEFITNMQAIDSVNGLLESYKDYIDKPKLLKSLLLMVGISPSEIASKEFATILQEIEKGTYDETKHKKSEPEDEGDSW